MAVEGINATHEHNHGIKVLAQGAVVGATAGIAGKYVLPLTKEEKTSDEYIKVMNRIHTQKTEYNFRTDKHLNALKAKLVRSEAEDEFIKLFDGMKAGEHVKPSRIRNALVTLTEKNPLQAAEFRNICKETTKLAENTAKQCENAYKLVTKHIRPTSFFAIAGGLTGIAVALTANALKTDVKH